MAKSSRLILLSGMLLFVLLVSLAYPAVASAQDGAPPPATEEPVDPATGGVVQPPGEGTPPPATDGSAQPATEVSVVWELEVSAPSRTAATETPVEQANDTSPIAESQIEESTAIEKATVAEVLRATPEDIQVAVLDEAGEVLPLASEEAAEISAIADPMWCPTGQVPGDAGCTASYATVTELIASLGKQSGAGTVYFTANYSTADATFDHSNVNLAGLTDLTLQGGWNGLNGASYGLSGISTFSVPLTVTNWAGNVTIMDITIDGATATGLTVFAEGDINLDHVTSNNNTGNGAYLDNASGSGSVNVSSSTLSRNGGDGLDVYSSGDITLSHVTVNSNAADGAFLDNSDGSGNVNISSSTFGGGRKSGNGLTGLESYTNGNTTLSQVTAKGNWGQGGAGASLEGVGTVEIRYSNFNQNDGGGVMVNAGNSITLSSVTANGNGTTGAGLINIFGGNVLISNSNFDGNARGEGVGLGIVSLGNVELDTVSASNNLHGVGSSISGLSVIIQNSTFDGNGFDGAQVGGNDVSIICSQFENNGGVGVDGSEVDGTFTLNDVIFEGNNDGEYIYNGTPILQSGGCTVIANARHGNFQSGLPLHTVPVNGEQVKLNCSEYNGTELVLPNGDKVILHCPFVGEVVLTGQSRDQLKGQLDDQHGFLSALNVLVTRAGQVINTVHPEMTVDFVIPANQQGANLAILHWDGAQWFELPEHTVTANGYFQARTSYTGLFVLITK